MRHKLISAGCMVAIALTGAAPVLADPNSHGASCQASAASPGNSATSPGSVHNEPGINSVGGGKGGAAYSAAQANNNGVSQYDISCTRVSTNTNSTGGNVGTPIQVALPNPMTGLSTALTPNNSQATRTANGTTSHTGAGK
jgi:hypothetical protein